MKGSLLKPGSQSWIKILLDLNYVNLTLKPEQQILNEKKVDSNGLNLNGYEHHLILHSKMCGRQDIFNCQTREKVSLKRGRKAVSKLYECRKELII